MLTKIAIFSEARRDFCPISRFCGKARRDFSWFSDFAAKCVAILPDFLTLRQTASRFSGFSDFAAKCVAILPDFLIFRQSASRFCRISNFEPKFDAPDFESARIRNVNENRDFL